MDDFTIKDLFTRKKTDQTSEKPQTDNVPKNSKNIDDTVSFKFAFENPTKLAQSKKAPESPKTNGESFNSKPIIMVEPNYGRFVTLEIAVHNEFLVGLYQELMDSYMEGLEQFGIKWRYEGKKYFIEHPDEELAEMTREAFRK
jgi:hypothetical protein